MDIVVKHDAQAQKFYTPVNGGEAYLRYELPEDNAINFTETFVPEPSRGKGIGEQLAEAAIAYARQNDYRMIPTCPFVSDYIHANHR